MTISAPTPSIAAVALLLTACTALSPELAPTMHTPGPGPATATPRPTPRPTPVPEPTFRATPTAAPDYTGQTLDGHEFSRVELAGTNFAGASLIGAVFDNADLAGASFAGAILDDASFSETEAQDANFDGASLARAFFGYTNLERASFRAASLTDAVFAASPRWARSGTRFEGNESNLTGADLTGALLDGSDFSGAIGITDDMLASALGVPLTDLGRALTARRLRLETDQQITDAVEGGCDGTPQPHTAPYDEAARFHPLGTEFLGVDARAALLPLVEERPWLAPAARFVEILLCTESSEKERVKSCGSYSSGNVTVSVYLTRIRTTFTIREARTGETIGQRDFHTVPERECPEEVSVSLGASVYEIPSAEPIDYQDVADFIGSFVGEPPAED